MTELHSLSLTRRSLLGTGAALVAANALPSGALAQGAKFRRWEITDPAMPPRVLESYKKGIGKMLGLPPTDPRNWYRNAFVHVFDCPHQNWWFLAWHRAYLGWLEVTLRDLSEDKDFALPYWDWTKTPRVPAAMFEGVLDPNNAAFIPAFDKFKAQFEAPVAALYASFSPAQNSNLSQRGVGSPADFWDSAVGMFFEQPEARGLTAANPDLDPATKIAVSMATITNALRTPTFAGSAAGPDPAGFDSAKATSHNGSSREGVLEGQPHDNVHGAMGGPGGAAFMVSFLSPVDPIFFLHHGNLDRLWDVWTRRQFVLKQPALPEGADLTTWSAEQFLFFSDDKGLPVSKTSPGDYTTWLHSTTITRPVPARTRCRGPGRSLLPQAHPGRRRYSVPRSPPPRSAPARRQGVSRRCPQPHCRQPQQGRRRGSPRSRSTLHLPTGAAVSACWSRRGAAPIPSRPARSRCSATISMVQPPSRYRFLKFQALPPPRGMYRSTSAWCRSSLLQDRPPRLRRKRVRERRSWGGTQGERHPGDDLKTGCGKICPPRFSSWSLGSGRARLRRRRAA